ncbi:PREDICTED: uncharacterized protein LOC109335442 [Lupinus angustifolius]|uniref:uncharacterized protein LOC109335442 n=1 Tax=Lupinus angustifolius TaxID=3871 RepID=UPI00092FB7D4|nr:PREDICTED: uncharacterized protein LOC109335442 [Lupinus angustifolius]
MTSSATPIPNDVLLKPIGNNIDMAWEWNHMKDPNNKKSVTCNFRGHTGTSGITRAKKHQMGVTEDTDRKGRTLINFMVNCPLGIMFVKSVDTSRYKKTGDKLVEPLDCFICGIGEENVVQVVTDNGSNYVLVGKYLEAKGRHIFWTPCVAHCMDLMLKDIGKLDRVKRAVQRGYSLVSFIYNHIITLNTMRKFTKKTELVRAEVAKFATNILMLQRLHDQKGGLRKMFTSNEWMNSNATKDAKRKNAIDIVMLPSFWSDVPYCLKVMGPLVKVSRLVDNKKHPAIGYIYEAMDRAKETMIGVFQDDEKNYNDLFDIIDKRWQCQLHHPLHVVGHFLNPKHYYKNPEEMDNDSEVTLGLYQCIERLCLDEEEVDKASKDLSSYRRSIGTFSLKATIRQRDTLHPTKWWKNYGTHVPNLRKITMKVLNLTCSSSGCKHNWSTFEQLNDIDDYGNEWVTRKVCEDGEVVEEDEQQVASACGDENVAAKVYNLSNGDNGPDEENYLGDSDDY